MSAIPTTVKLCSQDVRFVLKDGAKHYVAKDIAKVLDHKSIYRAITEYTDEEKTMTVVKTDRGSRNTRCLTEAGVARLCLTSRHPNSIKICEVLGIKTNYKVVAKETNFVAQIMKAFASMKIELQYYHSGYRIDLYFVDHKVAVEFDEKHHEKQKKADRMREADLKKALGCKFVRAKHDDSVLDVISNITSLLLA